MDEVQENICVYKNSIIHPRVGHYPKIIAFLGYFPFEAEKANFGERITYYRYTHDLTPKEFGKLTKADSSTVLAWEAGEHMPSKRKIEIIEEFTNGV